MSNKNILSSATLSKASYHRAHLCNLVMLFVLISTSSFAQSSFSSEQLLKEYNNIEEKLLNMRGEIASIEDFVYKKDAATFTFSKGKVLFLRPILNRPTVAIFVGKGSVIVPIPYDVERQCLETVSGDTIVEESFNVCYIRFADNLDSILRSEFTFREGRLSAKESRLAKNAQGEFFFKPQRWQGSDNYFQLLRSAYARSSAGFFWAKFNRYVYSFDPFSSQETTIEFEREPTSLSTFIAAQFSESRRVVHDSLKSFDLEYPVVCVKKDTQLKLGGSAGYNILDAKSTMSIVVNETELMFLSVFLSNHLKVDSILSNGQKGSFQRRRESQHIGVMLPQRFQKGDTIELAIHYHGKNWSYPFPYIMNPSKYQQTLTVSAPKDYNYLFSGVTTSITEDGKEKSYSVSSGKFLSEIGFFALATGWDTLSGKTSFGLPVSFILEKSDKHTRLTNNNILLNEESRNEFLKTFNYFYELLGKPPVGNNIYVRLGGYWWSSTAGLIDLPIEITTKQEYGGAILDYSSAAAGQWFSTAVQLKSYRENWIRESIPRYLSYMCVESMVGIDAYAYNLMTRREEVMSLLDKNEDLPLACGVRGLSSKGVWLIHMLRKLMNSVDSTRDESFNSWLRDVVRESYKTPLSNKKFQVLAERHFGYDLSWFFDKWLYGRGIVEYDISYSTEKADEGYFLNLDIVTSNVQEDYLAPVILTFETGKKPKYINAFITPKYRTYKYGPFDEEPTKFSFNRYMGVLSKNRIKEVKN